MEKEKIIDWIKNKSSYHFKGMDIEADSEPGNVPATVKIRNRIESLPGTARKF